MSDRVSDEDGPPRAVEDRVNMDQVTDSMRYTKKELKKMAKDRGVKLENKNTIEYLRSALGMEPLDYPSRYNHCKQRKIAQPDTVILTNKRTGEESSHKTIYKASKHLDVNPNKIAYRLKTGGDQVKGEEVYESTDAPSKMVGTKGPVEASESSRGSSVTD